jgi:hypothetical protein
MTSGRLDVQRVWLYKVVKKSLYYRPQGLQSLS